MSVIEAVDANTVNVIEQQKYRADKAFQVLFLLLLCLAFAVGIVGFMLLLRSTVVPPPVYFLAGTDGALVQEKPLDQPGLETNELLNWITEAMMESYTFNFVDYNTVIDAAKVYYTKEGYESYKTVLDTTKITEAVTTNKLVLTGIATDAPQLLLEKPFAGRYMWKIKIPMRLRYQNVRTDFNSAVDVTVIVMRVPTTESPNGVLILKLDLEQRVQGS